MERHWRANTGAPILLAQQLHAQLSARGAQPMAGAVVNLLDQKLWNPNPDFLSYTLSKAALEAAKVPCGAINSVPEVFEDPQVLARGMLKYVPHPCGVPVPQVSSPMRFAQTPLQDLAAPPLLGQHSRQVLEELGYSAERIDQLQAAGVL